MIVGEEAKSVEATLHNVLDHMPICAYSVCGAAKTSSDTIADFMLQRGVPGVFQDAAVDDRTEAMEKARVVALEHSCDYILMHDSDKMFYGRVEIPEEPYADAYLFRFGEGPCRLRLFSSQRRWAFRSLPHQGVVQEYAYCQSGPSVETDMPGDFYVSWSRNVYDVVEIGTCDFDLEVEKKYARVLSVEPLKCYFDRIPVRSGCTKVNVAVSDAPGTTDMYYVPIEDRISHGLPDWISGCNSLGKPHKTVENVIESSGLQSLRKTLPVRVVSYGQLMANHAVSGVGYLKIDTEGHDPVILKSMIEYCDEHTSCFPQKIQFESNGLSDIQLEESVLQMLIERGYQVISRSHDTVLRRDYPLYILNYKSPERRAKLERRMSWSGIKSATWCAGVEDPDRVWSYTRGHLLNIDNFVENSTAEWGIFAEDDIILCPGFYDRVNQIDTDGFDVILLGYLLCEDPRHRPDIYPPVGKQLYGFPEDLWGAQCYMLRRAHAVHLLTTYTIDWALANPDQTFSSDFILTKRGRRALVFPPLVIEEGPDSEAESNGQNIFHRRCRVFLNRWVTDFEHMGAIERVIHLTWKDPNVTELPLKLVQSGLAALKRLNPTYEFRMHSDEQVEAYLRDKLSVEDYECIADRHIVEKVDLWRLLKIYHEGGVYCDIDRLVNIPLDAFLKPHHKFALPFYLDSDFSQDVMISASGNPIHKRAIELNLERRRAGETNLYMLGPITYFHAATECLLGYQLDRSPPAEEMHKLKAALEAMGECVHTEREEPPFQTMLFKGPAIMDYEDAKMELYRRCGLRHWSGAW